MKRLLFGALGLAGLLAAAAACQPATSADRPAAAARTPAAPTALADSTAAVRALLRQLNLRPLWGDKTFSTEKGQAMDGFYGPDNYRISFYFDRVRQDSLHPEVYHVWGRDRYKKVITPFTATLTVTRLAPLPDTTHATSDLPGPVRGYTAFASFVLREDSTARGAGHCRGRAALDFYVDQHRQARLAIAETAYMASDNPTEGCGLVFRGTWQDNRTGRQQPVSWANFYGVLVPDVLREMGLGNRGDELNPRLARYGWSEIWENDEWWATSPKPKLHL